MGLKRQTKRHQNNTPICFAHLDKCNGIVLACWRSTLPTYGAGKSPVFFSPSGEPASCAVNLEPPTGRQEISGHWEINPYKFVSPIYWKRRDFAPIGPKAEAGLPPSTGRASSKRQRRRLSGEPRASAEIESALGRAF